MSPPSPAQTSRTRPIPQTREMPIQTRKGQIPRGNTQRRHTTDGSRQTEGYHRLGSPKMRQRHPSLPKIHGLLPILRPQLLQDSTTVDPTDPKEHTIPLVGATLQSIQNTQNTHVPETHPLTTRLWKTILPRHRCFVLQHGSHTLTGGRNQPSNKQNHASPNSLLLGHIHTN